MKKWRISWPGVTVARTFTRRGKISTRNRGRKKRRPKGCMKDSFSSWEKKISMTFLSRTLKNIRITRIKMTKKQGAMYFLMTISPKK
jgi:hypothetical protein